MKTKEIESRFRIRIGILLVISMFLNAMSSAAQPARHVVLITIDGLRPEFYQDPVWGMVNLAQLKKHGIFAESVKPIFPSMTFPNHTTMVTGLQSSGHGIFYNTKFDSKKKAKDLYWYFSDIKAPTLWEAARTAKMKTASVNWPVTVGAPIDYNVPAFKKAGVSQLEATIPVCTPGNFLSEIQEEATGKLADADFEKDKDYIVQDQTMASIAAYIIQKYKPGFITVHLSVVDHFQHKEGREGETVKVAVAGADQAIRTIIESVKRAGIEDSTAIIVTGDHGHVDTHTLIAPNVWLADAGLIGRSDDSNWKAQFYSAGGSAFLYLKDNADTGTVRKVFKLLNDLPSRIKDRFDIIDKKALSEMGADPEAVMAISAKGGFAFTNAATGDVFRSTAGATHGHLPNLSDVRTGFVASGAGLRTGVIIPEMEITDVAPIISHLLGLKFIPAHDIIKGLFK